MDSNSTLSPEQARSILSRRKIDHVVVLGANGSMGYGSAALFTSSVDKVTFLARTKEKAELGLSAAIDSVRSPSVSTKAEVGSYDEDFEATVSKADLIFEAVTEDLDIKQDIFDRVEQCRRPDSIVATVTSGLSINKLCEGRNESFRRNFLGLHFFNPPNVIVGTELISAKDTDPELVEFIDVYSTYNLGRTMIRTYDTAGFAGNRIGFKVLNEAAQLAYDLGPVLVDKIIGPYTGRAMTPLATIDLVGWDIHRAIVDNIYELTPDEAHDTLKMPSYMTDLMEKGTLGRKSGKGFFMRDGDVKLALNPKTSDYSPINETSLPDLSYINEITNLYSRGRYQEGLNVLINAPGDEAAIARRILAGYISYAFNRVGEVTDTITGIDLIMGQGFNWAPPSVLVDTMGLETAIKIIEDEKLVVPKVLSDACGTNKKFFQHPQINIGKFFIAG